MMSMNKLLIPSILIATILVAGAFTFVQIDKASAVHFEIIDAVIGVPGVTNQEIIEDLEDKLKLMNATNSTTAVIDFETVDGYNIVVEALDGNGTNVNFNLKEVYLCGTAPVNTTILVDKVYIENIVFDGETNEALGADVIIASKTGGPIGFPLVISNSACVDVLASLAASGRAGANGLGSDKELAIVITGSPDDVVEFVKCIAFTPNEAVTLRCDIQPFSNGDGPPPPG